MDFATLRKEERRLAQMKRERDQILDESVALEAELSQARGELALFIEELHNLKTQLNRRETFRLSTHNIVKKTTKVNEQIELWRGQATAHEKDIADIDERLVDYAPVSYTHLTLPTIA